ncbi:hypothetical protein ACRQ5Q_15080 [Bradyrhizobium sp. PMVTL-01]|uniref:hypothetical protein n=1 Tax=Bradyrhizobium sp. PMVTL-01 TaxID=3434999 RepID=UPI003F716D9C
MFDLRLAEQLDSQWRTASAIRRRLKRYDYDTNEMVNALRKLAKAGRVERKEIDTGVARPANRRLGSTITVEYFRKLHDDETSCHGAITGGEGADR